MPLTKYLMRQAASLLRFAKETNDPEVAAVLLAKAADFTEKLEQLPRAKQDVSPRAPDVEPEI
jgi:hypothetical protein